MDRLAATIGLVAALLLGRPDGALAGGASARAGGAPPIRLRARTIQPAARFQLDAHPAIRARVHGAEPVHVIVQLERSPGAELRAALGAHGIVLQGYLPDDAYIATVRPGADLAGLAALPVSYLGELLPTDKLAPSIRERRLPAHAVAPDGRVALYVEFHRDAAPERELGALMRDLGARVLGRVRSLGGAVILVGEEDWALVAAMEAVKWVEPASPRFAELNDGVRVAIGAESLQAPAYGLSGAGVGVLIYDGGLVCPLHPDLGSRVTRGESGADATHATHVAGTLAGSGATSGGVRRGMAPAARIISYGYESCEPSCLYNNPQDLEANYLAGRDLHGADFASNSIGSNVATNGYDCELEGDYESTARLVDAIARGVSGPPFASFWAAGNERQGAARCGDGFDTIGIPATAKNNIVVGAIGSDDDTIADFSSLGPVDDGRMRPDVVAPGCQVAGDGGITSTRSCAGYTVLCGTSMATPAVAGVAALVLERLRDAGNIARPLPSTFKAILAVSAVDLGNPGPDYTYGYGKVDARAAIALVDSGLVEEGTVAAGEVQRWRFDVPAGLARLRAALAWDDVPGEPLSAVNLVNDLDLRLIGPDQSQHLAFVLDPAAPAAPAERGINRRDPSELVEVARPAPGVWTLEVHGGAIPDGPQTFSIAVDVPSTAATGLAGRPQGGAAPALVLRQNRPNPFNPWTTIAFGVGPGPGRVGLRIYDAAGRIVRVLVDRELPAGEHAVRWDGRDLGGNPVASGIYFCELGHRGRRAVRRMALTR